MYSWEFPGCYFRSAKSPERPREYPYSPTPTEMISRSRNLGDPLPYVVTGIFGKKTRVLPKMSEPLTVDSLLLFVLPLSDRLPSLCCLIQWCVFAYLPTYPRVSSGGRSVNNLVMNRSDFLQGWARQGTNTLPYLYAQGRLREREGFLRG